jgi:tetratricopeptide (TPR) repeat protein
MIKLKTTLQFGILLLIYSCGGHKSSFSDAQKDINDKNYKEAIEILSNIIKEQPSFDSAYLERAYAYMVLGDIQNSSNDYNHIIVNPSFKISALAGIASLSFNTGDYQKAFDNFSKIIKIDKNNFHAYLGRGYTKMQLKIYGTNKSKTSWITDKNGEFYYDYDGALEDLNKAIELNSEYSDSYIKRGDLYVELKKNDKALKDYNYAIKLDSNSYDAYFKRALLYEDIGNSNKSLADFDKAIQLDPTNPLPYVNRGYLKRELLKDKDGACKDFEKAEKLGFEITDNEKKYCD